MKNRITSGIFFIIFWALIALGPQYIFKVCQPMGNQIMKCFCSARAEIGVGAIILILGILLIVFKSTQIRVGFSISIALLGILTALIPSILIGVCEMETMHCRILALPSLVVIGILMVVASLVNAIYLYRLGNKGKEENEV